MSSFDVSPTLGIDAPIDRETLGDAAVERIRASIMSGSLAPGERLDQAALAKHLGVSRMPVRDALRQLEREGFVVVRKGSAHVVDLDKRELRMIYDIREALEPMAARLAAPHAQDSDIERVRALVEAMTAAARQNERAAYLQLDRDFHLSSYRPCENSWLLQMIGDLMNATWSYRIAVVCDPHAVATTHRGHLAMVEALATRDGDRFAALTRQHLHETVEAIEALK